MSLIEKVAELQKLEAEATPGPFFAIELAGSWSVGTSEKHIQANDLVYTGKQDAEMFAALRNAAPAMLDALSLVRAGDVDEISYAIQELTRIFGPDSVAETIEVLRRYQELARLVEAQP